MIKKVLTYLGTNSTASAATENTAVIKCPELSTSVKINSTDEPDFIWDVIKASVQKEPYETLKLDTPIYENKIRFVCISDTHSKIDRMQHQIPSGDILIHAGDFTSIGKVEEVKKFSEFLKTLDDKFQYKVVIAGNHELSFDKTAKLGSRAFKHVLDKDEDNKIDPREHVKNCIYLEDSMIELFGIKIYGAPWQPRFGDWAFNVDRGNDILKKWNKIPEKIDVLITHGPPLGFGDKVSGGYHVGCAELLTTIRERVLPRYHIFGHIHEDYGSWKDNKNIKYINASTCNLRYMPSNAPILFDIELPEGVSKMNL